MASFDVQTLNALQESQSEHEPELLALQNVVGVGLSTKITREEDTGEPSITVFVDQKMDLDAVPEAHRIPRKIGDFKTDVVATGTIFAGDALAAEPIEPAAGGIGVEVLRKRIRPVEGGYSVGHYRITAGTYATAVYDAKAFPGIPPRYYVLSNNHVLADSNSARIGDPILQPGPYDGGTVPADVIARLSRFVPINFAAGASNYVDAAIAEGNFDTLDREIYWIGYTRGATAPTLGALVQKTGRTTNWTTGKITAVNATVNVNYGGGRVAKFVRQFLTTNMSAGGDSGSLVLDLEERAVGLLFAGSASVTVVNDIRYVQLLLGIRVV
jgi:hypothetical protein